MLFYGKPLFIWTIELALEINFIEEIIVVTDDEFIIEECSNYPRIRVYKDLLAGKHGRPTWMFVKEALEGYDEKTIVIHLQPTTPLRIKEDVIQALELYVKTNNHVIPGYIDYENNAIYTNGLIFINTLGNIIKNKGFVYKNPTVFTISKERSIDINYEEEFIKAEKIMEERIRNGK